MQLTALLLPLALLPTAALAVGKAAVVNHCTFASYLWSADSSNAGSGTGRTLAPSTGTYSETYRGKGIALKLSKRSDASSLYDPNNPITQFQYTLDGSTVYYSLADSRGDIYKGQKVVLKPSDPSCTTITWAQGTGPSAVYTCSGNANLTLTLC